VTVPFRGQYGIVRLIRFKRDQLMTAPARDKQWQRVRGMFALLIFICAAAGTLGVASIAYVLAPRWPQTQAAPDAPPLPIVVAGVVFNIPPAAIRVPLQRRAGPQERLDLVYRWPELTPPDPRRAGAGGARAAESAENGAARLFVTIETARAVLPATERLKSIYPRYADAPEPSDTDGLTVMPFRDGTPYQGEDMIYDASAPDRFLARCSRARGASILATCLYERPMGAAAITFRFPREWLADWRAVTDGIDRLIARWRPAGP
jgi:hypothetical protein